MNYLPILFFGILLGLLIFYFVYKLFLPKAPKMQIEYDSKDAEDFLVKKGFKVLERQKRASIIVFINGKSHLGTEWADYIVEKENKKYAVKVVSDISPDPTEPNLRRKLIEFQKLFSSYGVLLADLSQEELHEISFKFPRPEKETLFTILVVLLIIGVVAGIVGFFVSVKIF